MGFLFSLLLGLMGVGIGAYGTLIGVGGGVILVPLLLYLYPQELPRTITSISFAVVFLNALSGTIAYKRMRRIDYRTGLIFSVATIPGVILGVLANSFLSRNLFQLVFGIMLTAMAIYIFLRPKSTPVRLFRAYEGTKRHIVDYTGLAYEYSFDLRLGVVLSFAVGFIAGILGIGGGVIHVPLLISLLGFPPHVATATSHFILVITALFGTLTHMAAGDLNDGWKQTLILGAGVIIGAQIGAKFSSRVGGTTIVRLLALALLFLGIRLLWP
ncbi:MAG: sulfite exporter TauE/SafE family protein [Dehalococcoidia bacterium]|nr:sulfite exporter TauE/SafE family protein [Dehalococcoidia bacterium]